MKYSMGRKAKMVLAVFFMKTLWFVDLLGSIPEKIVLNLGRTTLYLIVVFSLLTGFFLEAKSQKLYMLADIFSPSPDVLGATASILEKPYLVKKQDLPKISARSVYAVDMENEKVLLELNSGLPLPPASTTKIMTALAAMDIYSLDEALKMPDFCTKVDSQKIGFKGGEMISIKDLLYALLVGSSGDAACALSLGKVSYEQFIDLMNSKASQLGLEDTHFANPIGLDDDNNQHTSTAKDLYVLAETALKSDFIKNAVATREYMIYNLNSQPRGVVNTNDLLWNLPGTVGVKTGKTYAAGEVLIYEYKKDGKDIVIVVMGSMDRFSDTKLILQWLLDSYSWGGGSG